ncbi:DUF3298 and DUF4163 domain-containing protein [Clostridium rectalis]|uniref:DUF3298 and DUF4163 domain-containing protein n=1 Tax=Clostridium rectalis TaxID=2040295 RepID=UPI000F6440CD|nr:DUF3298 and DUF4163 domain-containing protein [Clostridium rectalis]
MKKILYIVLASVMTISSTSIVSAKNYSSSLTKNFIITNLKYNILNESARILCKNTKDIYPRLDTDIKMPVVYGLKNKTIEYKINTLIDEDILINKSKILNYSKEDTNLKNKYIFNVDYNLSYNKNNILSITLIYYEYTGGAHGITTKKTFNINTKTGKLLTLKDLFCNNENFKHIINNYIKNEISKNPKIYFKNTFKTISENQSFFIENNNIVIYFGLYEIAPYSSGIREFRVPFNNFKYDIKVIE